MMRHTPLLLVCVLLCVSATADAAGDTDVQDDPERRDGPSAGGRLMWDSSDELDLLGDLWADVPFRTGRTGHLFLRAATRTEIEKTTDALTFLVRALQYEVDLGWRAPMRWAGGNTVSFYVGQRGREGVDRPGQAYLRYLGFGLSSPGFRLTGERRPIDWRVALGPVIHESEVEGDLVLEGRARFRPLRESSMLRADVGFFGYLDGGTLRGDLTVGPAVEFAAGRGNRFSLFAYWLDSDNPLGVGHSSVLVGFDYEKGADAGRARGPAPDIGGHLAAGVGPESRRSGQLLLRLSSPRFVGAWYARVEFDVNVLTAEGTGDLFYLYYVGLERAVERLLVGGYFFHRSNHVLAEPNDTVTSTNVAQLGGETRDWSRVGPRHPLRRWGTLDWRARAGYLIDSSFGEDVRWHLQGGARWTGPFAGVAPFLRAWAATGDVERRIVGVGVSLPPAWDVELRYLRDDQLFAEEQDAWLAVARYGF